MPQIAPDAVSEHENTQKYLAPLDNVIRYLNVAPPPPPTFHDLPTPLTYTHNVG